MLQGTHQNLPQDRIVYGRPAADVIREAADRHDARAVFVMTSRSVARTPHLMTITKALGARLAGLYDGITAHSPRESVVAGANAARQARADLLVAVGGGSVIDATKLMLLCVWQGLETTAELEPFHAVPVIDLGERLTRDGRPPIRMLAVPNTLSGAEFTMQAGVTDTARQFKQSFLHPLFTPLEVVLDPEATRATPPWLLHSTGVRAVDHCVETFCSTKAWPYSDALSVEALSLLFKALPRLQAAPDDMDNRGLLQLAVWMSISGFMNGVPLGASHGISRVLGGSYGVPHGRTSCITLPAVLRWNATVNAQRQHALNDRIGAPRATLAESVEGLVRLLGEPARLTEIDFRRADLPDLAAKSMEKLKHHSVAGNPRTIAGPSDVMQILDLAWQ
jgi:maleylacetate reductase